MLNRCRNPNYVDWPNYGGRGIRVCDEWHDWPTFKKWALDAGYSPELELDRVDNDGPYSPDNCRFTTLSRQRRNRRITPMLTAFGETKPLADWAEDPRCAVGYTTLSERYHKDWSHEQMITLPNVRGQRIQRKL
jgi:hypothetical protein